MELKFSLSSKEGGKYESKMEFFSLELEVFF